MFNKLKEKLKSWFSSAKTQAEEQEKVEKTLKKESKPKIKEGKVEEKLKKIAEKATVEIHLEPSLDKQLRGETITEGLKGIEQEIKPENKGFFIKLKEKFSFKVTKEYFAGIWENLELILLENNVSLKAIDQIKENLEKELIGKEIKKDDLEQEIKSALKSSIENLFVESFDLIEKIRNSEKPFVILFVGINGSGKTTTIAKLAYLLEKHKLKVVLAAADTFRAASIEQLSLHADKLKVPIIKHEYGSDPASVGFDAIKHAQSHNLDVVLIDTAGRMHTKENLIKEMEKICRVTKPDLKLFIGESITGNDATEQAEKFNEAIQIDGIILSKADVDEKGGTAISVSKVTGKPILYLGVGQRMEDLKEFKKEEIIKSLGL